ncbi:MAG: DUF2846 domain-containing protein [Myxococcota bacterium]|nr:DUF2846 domain-containing protein [Myxococcota bacterium]
MRSATQTAHLAFIGLSLVFFTACAPTVPTGTSFKPLAPPDAQDTLVYIYRQDSLRGVDGVEIKLDGEKLGRLLNGEYLAFLVDPGHHELKARMKWFQVVPRSWNSLDFSSRPGETVYLRVWAAYDTQAGRDARSADPTASSDSPGDVGLFLGIQKPKVAMEELKSTRRAAGH